MKQDSLEKLLNEGVPPPNPAARLAARRVALEEFARVYAADTQPPQPAPAPRRNWFQGLSGGGRLSRDNDSHGREAMPWYSRRLVIGGAASAFIALFGVTLVWNTYRENPRIATIDLQEVASEPVSRPSSAAGTDETSSLSGGPAPESDGDANAASAPAETGTAVPRTVEPYAGAITRDGAASSPAADSDAAARAMQRTKSEVSRSRAEAEAETQGAADRALLAAPAEAAPVAGADAVEMRAPPAAPPPSPAVDTVTAESVQRARMARQPGNVEEVVVKGRRATSQRRTGPKSSAPARSGSPSTGWYERDRPSILTPQSGNRDRFEQFEANSVKLVSEEPVSTFSADVDTASYSFVRKQLQQGVLPQKDAVRAEEMINYFDYAWPAAENRQQPFRPTIVVSDSPWGKGRKLVHIGIKGYEVPASQRPDANLVMLIDVSGSMESPDKLPLVRQSMKLLLGTLKPTDTVGIVVYAGAAGTVLPPTPVSEKEKIVAALDNLQAGGSTAGAEGIRLAYQLAEQNFRKDGVNRILLCTDGDFNVGISGTSQLKGFVERKRESGVYLSVLGFGQGNYRDELAQALAQNGNGVAAYIDSLSEAQKVLVQQASSSLVTIARDVKLQVEFNPATVAEYRLVGYETRALKREDFNNDAVDAGDIGAGHTVTAIYEITPVGSDARMVDESRYQKQRPVNTEGTAREYGYLKIRYKLPGERRSKLIEQPIGLGGDATGGAIQRDVEFSTAVAGFAQLLRGGQFTGPLTYDDVIQSALASRGEDPYGYRSEFVQLVRQAKSARGM